MNKNILFKTFSALAATLLTSSLCIAGAQSATPKATSAPAQAAPAASADQDVVRAQLPSYPLKTCVVSGDDLTKASPAIDHVVKGRLVRLCCKDCIKEVDQNSAAAFQKIDAAVVGAQKPAYPLATCPVTGEKLGDKAVDHVSGTRLVRLANAGAVAQFDKDPKAAMQKVDRAWIDAQIPKYTAKTCPVSHEPLGGEMGDPVDVLYGTKLVRLCCKSCVRKFEKEPDKYLAAMN